VLLRLRVPGAMIIGAVISTTVLGLTTDLVYMPMSAKVFAQICAGAFIACSVKQGDIRHILRNWKAPVIIVLCFLCLNLLTGTLLYIITDLDRMTCYLCAIPGGLTDIPILAEEMGGDLSVVLTAQFLRLIVGLLIFPLIATRLSVDDNNEPIKDQIATSERKGYVYMQLFLTLMVATLGGLCLRLIRFPAGTLVGAMIAVLAFNMISGKAYLPRIVRRITQALAGAYIGSSIGIENILLLFNLRKAMLLITGMYCVGGALIALVLYKKCGFTQRSALLAAMPAGASDVTLIAADMKVNTSEIAVIQLVRMISAVAVFPQILFLLLSLGFPFYFR